MVSITCHWQTGSRAFTASYTTAPSCHSISLYQLFYNPYSHLWPWSWLWVRCHCARLAGFFFICSTFSSSIKISPSVDYFSDVCLSAVIIYLIILLTCSFFFISPTVSSHKNVLLFLLNRTVCFSVHGYILLQLLPNEWICSVWPLPNLLGLHRIFTSSNWSNIGHLLRERESAVSNYAVP